MSLRRTALLAVTAGAALAVSACQDAVAETAAPVAQAAAPVIDLTVEQLIALQATGEIRLIDVRTPEEVAEGMIAGAMHIPLDDLEPAKLDFSDGRKPVFYCRSGRRSAQAAGRMSEHLGEPVQHLEGGILAWQEAGQLLALPEVIQ